MPSSLQLPLPTGSSQCQAAPPALCAVPRPRAAPQSLHSWALQTLDPATLCPGGEQQPPHPDHTVPDVARALGTHTSQDLMYHVIQSLHHRPRNYHHPHPNQGVANIFTGALGQLGLKQQLTLDNNVPCWSGPCPCLRDTSSWASLLRTGHRPSCHLWYYPQPWPPSAAFHAWGQDYGYALQAQRDTQVQK